jgi:hypothetical protein
MSPVPEVIRLNYFFLNRRIFAQKIDTLPCKADIFDKPTLVGISPSTASGPLLSKSHPPQSVHRRNLRRARILSMDRGSQPSG